MHGFLRKILFFRPKKNTETAFNQTQILQDCNLKCHHSLLSLLRLITHLKWGCWCAIHHMDDFEANYCRSFLFSTIYLKHPDNEFSAMSNRKYNTFAAFYSLIIPRRLVMDFEWIYCSWQLQIVAVPAIGHFHVNSTQCLLKRNKTFTSFTDGLMAGFLRSSFATFLREENKIFKNPL